MSDEANRLKMIFSSQGGEALDEAMQKLPENSAVRDDLNEWRKTFEETSFDSDCLSEIQYEDAIDAKGHSMVKKAKFDYIYQKAIHKGTEVRFGHD